MRRIQIIKGSVLAFSLILLFILITLSIAIVQQESIARRSFIRSRFEAIQHRTIYGAVEKYKGSIINDGVPPSGSDCPPLSGKRELISLTDPDYTMNVEFSSSGSVYNPPPADAGKDFTKVPEVGYFGPVAQNTASLAPEESGYIAADIFGGQIQKGPINPQSNSQITNVNVQLSYAQSSSYAPIKKGYNDILVPPWHTLLSFQAAVTGRSYIAVYKKAFPYAAYAPKGKIRLDDAVAVANPTMAYAKEESEKEENKDKDLTDIYSGVPVRLYAEKDIIIDKFPHGRAYSVEGPIRIFNKLGGIGFSGIKPEKNFAQIIQQQLDKVYEEVSKDTLDKTSFIIGRPLQITTLIKGNASLKDIFSIEQSLEFPFPVIPTFSTIGIIHTIQLHAPFISDIATPYAVTPLDFDDKYNQIISNAQATMSRLGYSPDNIQYIDGLAFPVYSDAQINQAKTRLEGYWNNFVWAMTIAGFPPQDSLIPAAKQVLDQMKNSSNPAVRQSAILALSRISEYQTYIVKKQNYDDFFAFLAFKDSLSGNIGISPSTPRKIPETRKEESQFQNNEPSYPYGSIVGNLFNALKSLFGNLIQGNWSNAVAGFCEAFHDKIRVIHFSKFSYDTFDKDFIKFDREEGVGGKTKGFSLKSSWTIPKGRTMKLKCDAEIIGDLWIQEGAVLFVDGNLKVSSPAGMAYSANPLSPSGKIMMGDGSSLVVSGDLTAAGHPQYGSIQLTSPIGRVHYLTSGIFCKGKVNIPYGILPVVSMEQIGEWSGNSTLKTAMEKTANYIPSIAKVAGPFHRRNPSYFALHPATFRVIQLFYIPVPIPTPTATKNMLIDIFQYVSLFYSVELNAFLGEHTFTQTDWWSAVFGEGALPALPKLDAASTLNAFKTVSLGAVGDMESIAKTFIQNLGEQLFISLTTTIVSKIATTIIAHIVSNLVGIGEGTDAIIKMVLDQTFGAATSLLKQAGIEIDLGNSQQEQTMTQSFSNALSGAFKTAVDNAQTQLKNMLSDYAAKLIIFNEVPGLVVYSEKEITMGGYAASGLFISKKDLNISTSRVVGCLISLEGDINAGTCKLRYYPYFTRASIYIPEKLGLFQNLSALNPPKSGKTPLEIGVPYDYVLSEGWSTQ